MIALPLKSSLTFAPPVGEISIAVSVASVEASLTKAIAQIEAQDTEKGSVQPYKDGRYCRLVWREGGKVRHRHLGKPSKLAGEYRAMHERYKQVQRLKSAIADLQNWQTQYANLIAEVINAGS